MPTPLDTMVFLRSPMRGCFPRVGANLRLSAFRVPLMEVAGSAGSERVWKASALVVAEE